MKCRLFSPVLIAICLSVSSSFAHASKEKPVIGLSLDTLKEERWQRDRDIIVEEAKRLGAEVVVQSANSDDTRQVRDIESLITRGVDVLIVVPHNGNALSRAVKSANEENIPVIAYDRLIMNAKVDYYMTFDNKKVGETQATYLVSKLPTDRPARIVRIYGAPTDNNAKLVKEGQDVVLEPLIKAGKIEVVFEDWALDWKPENAKKIMNAAVTKAGTEIDAVIAGNDGTAGGAIQSLSEEGIAGKVLVVGQDADLAACQRILRGTQTMTVYKPLKELAIHAAQVAVDVAKGNHPEVKETLSNGLVDVPTMLEKVIPVDKENMEATIIADGFHKAEDLK